MQQVVHALRASHLSKQLLEQKLNQQHSNQQPNQQQTQPQTNHLQQSKFSQSSKIFCENSPNNATKNNSNASSTVSKISASCNENSEKTINDFNKMNSGDLDQDQLNPKPEEETGDKLRDNLDTEDITRNQNMSITKNSTTNETPISMSDSNINENITNN